jgi:hypothetical protein
MNMPHRLKLESEVSDQEDENEIFDLKKTTLDNLFYFSYGKSPGFEKWPVSLHDFLVSCLKCHYLNETRI